MNILFCSAGRRCELLKDFKRSLGDAVKIVVTDNSEAAPAMFFADRKYQVPLISDASYLDTILDICKKEEIDAVTTLIDPEIMLLAEHRQEFEALGVEVLAPDFETAKLCFDKYEMYRFLTKHQIPTVRSFITMDEFEKALADGEIAFPVFVKPRTGSGSVGARKVQNLEELRFLKKQDDSLMIQEYMDAVDMDADVYIDTVSHKAVSAFSKRKLSTTIGGANKTISFKDEKLFAFIDRIVSALHFNGPVDMDFFYRDGTYYLSEVNPRFGGAYLHAFGAGVDFPKLIANNVNKTENERNIGNYEEDVVMMMYDSVVITKL